MSETNSLPPNPSPSQTQATNPEPNPLRGTAGVSINGRRVIFSLTLGALADMAQAFGTRNNFQLFTRLQGEFIETVNERGEKIMAAAGPSMADLPAIVAALSNGAVSPAEARALEFGDFQSVMAGIGQAVAAAFPAPDPKKNGAETMSPTPTETSPSTDTLDSPSLT